MWIASYIPGWEHKGNPFFFFFFPDSDFQNSFFCLHVLALGMKFCKAGKAFSEKLMLQMITKTQLFKFWTKKNKKRLFIHFTSCTA